MKYSLAVARRSWCHASPALLAAFFLGLNLLPAAELPVGFVESIVVSDVELALDIDWDPDGGMWIASKDGNVWVVRESRTLALQIPVETDSDGGLATLVIDPNYAINNYVWLFYLTPPPMQSRLSRFTNVDDQLVDETVIYSIDQVSPGYNGGCVSFMLDGTILLGTGMDGQNDSSQDLFNQKGKLLRLNPDGSAPEDNPYFDGVDGDPLVWARGLRQPWRCTVQPGTGAVFFGEVGWRSWEEINLGYPGANFGWPDVEGPGQGPEPSDEPLYTWAHLPPPDNTSSAIGGEFAPAGNFPAEYVGDYFFADHNRATISRMQLDGFNGLYSVEAFGIDTQRPVSIRFGPDGAMYYAAWYSDDIRKIEYVGTEVAGGRVPQDLLIYRYAILQGQITLDWNPSCNSGDTNYSIYSGTIPEWDVVNAIVCSTDGNTARTVTPELGDIFYLVVPHNEFWAGSHGLDGEGNERAVTGSLCYTSVPTPCD